MVRWLVDWQRRRHTDYAHLTEDEHTAEGDKSPGVLMASGYIAGGSIAGIGVAISQGVTAGFNERLEKWMAANNPFFEGSWSNSLSLIPYAALVLCLFLAAREKFPSGRSRTP
jgi:hypothetical protein